MELHIVGAGFGRTGTLSLKQAIERLGLGPCYHMAEVFPNPDHIEFWRMATRGGEVDWATVFANYASTVDWPGCTFWREILARNPRARVLLSTRDPESWHRSVCNTIYCTMTMEPPAHFPPAFRDGQAMARELVIERTFHGRILDPDHAIPVYEAHNAAVRREVPAEQLIDYEMGSGWAPLCDAFGLPIPDEEFPRTNTTGEYRERIGLEPA